MNPREDQSRADAEFTKVGLPESTDTADRVEGGAERTRILNLVSGSADSLRIDLPEMGTDAERQLWEQDQKRVMGFLRSHAELFTDTIIVVGLETVSHAGNVEGGRKTHTMTNDPLLRFMMTSIVPLTMYQQPLDGRKMNKVIGKAKSEHIRLGITGADHKATPPYGDALMRQTHSYLMIQPWFEMDQRLRKDGGKGIDPEVIQAALRISAMTGRRLLIDDLENKTVGETKQTMEAFAGRDMFGDTETSASRRLGIQMAYSMVKALIYKLPTSQIESIVYDAHYKLLGINLASFVVLPSYRRLGLQKIREKHLGSQLKGNSVHHAKLAPVLAMIPESVNIKLMIPQIVDSILSGEQFEDFARKHLSDFETEVDPKWSEYGPK